MRKTRQDITKKDGKYNFNGAIKEKIKYTFIFGVAENGIWWRTHKTVCSCTRKSLDQECDSNFVELDHKFRVHRC